MIELFHVVNKFLTSGHLKKMSVSRNPGGGFKVDSAGRIIYFSINIYLLTPSPQSQTSMSSILTQP